MKLLQRIGVTTKPDKPEYAGREAEYWDQRFAAEPGQLRAPGHSALDEHQNAQSYRQKREFFRKHLTRWVPPTRPDGSPARILDAGCGPATFTPLWLELGYRVTGTDFSTAAINAAQANLGDRAAFLVNPLDTVPPAAPFDAVLCIDVLFHVVNEHTWLAALRALAGAAHRHAPVIIQEMLDPARRRSRHVRWRTRAEYDAAFADLGMRIDEHQVHYLDHEQATKDVLVLRHTA